MAYPSDDPSTIECPNCGERVYIELSSCPKCGLSFYQEDLPDGQEDESHEPAQGISLSALMYGVVITFALAFLVNFFASRVWSPGSLDALGQVVRFLAAPLGALAGSYAAAASISAQYTGRKLLLHGLLIALIGLVGVILLDAYWLDLSAGPPDGLTLLSWAAVLGAGPLGAWLAGQAGRRAAYRALFQPDQRGSKGEHQLYLDLLARVRHDFDTADRLIEYERHHRPGAPRAALIKNAIDRWERDNR